MPYIIIKERQFQAVDMTNLNDNIGFLLMCRAVADRTNSFSRNDKNTDCDKTYFRSYCVQGLVNFCLDMKTIAVNIQMEVPGNIV